MREKEIEIDNGALRHRGRNIINQERKVIVLRQKSSRHISHFTDLAFTDTTLPPTGMFSFT
jgi:hypothetical protein